MNKVSTYVWQAVVVVTVTTKQGKGWVFQALCRGGRKAQGTLNDITG